MGRFASLLSTLISVCILFFGVGTLSNSHAEVSKNKNIKLCLDSLNAVLQPIVKNRLSIYGWTHVNGDEFYSDDILGVQKFVLSFERAEPSQPQTKLSLHFKISAPKSAVTLDQAFIKYMPNNLSLGQKRSTQELDLEENVFKVVQEIKNLRGHISCELSRSH